MDPTQLQLCQPIIGRGSEPVASLFTESPITSSKKFAPAVVRGAAWSATYFDAPLEAEDRSIFLSFLLQRPLTDLRYGAVVREGCATAVRTSSARRAIWPSQAATPRGVPRTRPLGPLPRSAPPALSPSPPLTLRALRTGVISKPRISPRISSIPGKQSSATPLAGRPARPARRTHRPLRATKSELI